MSSRNRPPARTRVGRVTVYPHHGAWWVYYRDAGRPVRRRAGATPDEAGRVAAQVNAQLAAGAATLFAFAPLPVAELRRAFLDHHEQVLGSAVATVRRYAAATAHLEAFALRQARPPLAHEVRADLFAAHLRSAAVAPNGHPNTPRRRLRAAGVRFVLETCRALYGFAARRRHLPPYAANPFAELPPARSDDAKPVFLFDEAAATDFLRAAPDWAFPLHLTLATTGLRVGEAARLLLEDLDLAGGWLHVRNKPGLGWRVKTGHGRAVPLVPEVAEALRRAAGGRTAGPVFLRPRFAAGRTPALAGGLRELEAACRGRLAAAGAEASRAEALRVAGTVWRDAGAVDADLVRASFIRVARSVGRPQATCPKSWRHTFATLLQDANVDPLVRQVTLGHRPAGGGGLGMTARYTHTRPETQRRQVEQALRLWPRPLELARAWAEGGAQ